MRRVGMGRVVCEMRRAAGAVRHARLARPWHAPDGRAQMNGNGGGGVHAHAPGTRAAAVYMHMHRAAGMHRVACARARARACPCVGSRRAPCTGRGGARRVGHRLAVGADAVGGVVCDGDAEEDGAEDDEDGPDRMRGGVEDFVEDTVALEDKLQLGGAHQLRARGGGGARA